MRLSNGSYLKFYNSSISNTENIGSMENNLDRYLDLYNSTGENKELIAKTIKAIETEYKGNDFIVFHELMNIAKRKVISINPLADKLDIDSYKDEDIERNPNGVIDSMIESVVMMKKLTIEAEQFYQAAIKYIDHKKREDKEAADFLFNTLEKNKEVLESTFWKLESYVPEKW